METISIHQVRWRYFDSYIGIYCVETIIVVRNYTQTPEQSVNFRG